MRTADVAKLVSQAWKNLSCKDRAVFLDLAKKDKERYETEKANYTGPWKIVDFKDRNTPKRPMSAFLAYSNARRKEVTESNPTLSNGEISKVLAEMWRDASPERKQLYRDQENALRLKYKRSKGNTEIDLPVLPSSSTVLDCVSISSASIRRRPQRATCFDDDDGQSFGSFASVLESIADFGQSDEMSSSSPGVSVSDQTAKVSLLAGELDPMTRDSTDCSGQYTPKQGLSYQPLSYVMELPELESPYRLAPLIDTDFGGFLAAAAFLDQPGDGIFM